MQNFSPSVSVIVAAYNAQTTITACIDSLLQLNYPKNLLEIIVVDNQSKDNTYKLIEKYQEHGICIYSEKTKGASAARNCGIRNACHEIIAITDSDCTVDPNWVTNLVTPLQDENIGIVGGQILAIDPDNYVAKFGEKIHSHEAAICKETIPYVITMNWAAKKSFVEEIGMFDEDFLRSQDVDFSYRTNDAGYKLAYQSQAIVYHHNENTLWGLFWEGYTHGVSSVFLNKHHEKFLEKYRRRKLNWKSYQKIFRRLKEVLQGKDSPNAKCDLIFNLGKKLGKLTGSFKYGYLEI